MRSYLFFSVLFLLPFWSFAQFELTGTVQDSTSGAPIGSASVVVYPAGENSILGYDISDEEGHFKILVHTRADSLTLKISMLGYERFEQTLLAKAQSIPVHLSEKSVSLEEVFIRNPPIKQHGDTLIFDVDAFKSMKDRSIKEVLAKMPGIEIKPSGEIYYQGKPINKFYVEGLDLMGGQYNMIANNLQPDEVESVEILENHQPLKVLDSIVPSDQAAINLTLKKDVTLSGNLEAGGGAAPGLWYGSLTPMFFTKNFQALVTYQTNNTGTDVTEDFNSFSISAFRYGYRADSKNSWLSVAGPSTPSFSAKRWRDNEAHAGSVNVLFKDDNDFEYRINADYINRFTRREGGGETTYLLPQGDTLISREERRHARNQSMNVSLSVERNKESNFLKNKLSFSGQWDRAWSHINQNQLLSNQHLQAPYTGISNKFEIIFPWGKQLITLDSDIGYNESPQDLTLQPGVFANILSPGNPLDQVRQHVMNTRFYANHSLSFTKRLGKISLSFKPGIDFSRQELDSKIYLEGLVKNNPDFKNAMRWQKLSTYLNVGASYKSDHLNLFLSLPFELTQYKIENHINGVEREKNPFVFNPSLWGYYEFWDYWKATISGGYSKGYGPMDDIYSGYLLSSYRNLGRQDVPLKEAISTRGRVGLQYRNPINSWFGRIGYGRSKVQYDQINSLKTLPDGSLIMEAKPMNHQLMSNSIYANISKFIMPLRTTFKLSTNYSYSKNDILFNGNMIENTNTGWHNSLNLSGDFTNWLTVEYTASLGLNTTKNVIQSEREINSQSHELGIYVYLFDNHTLNFSMEWLKNTFAGSSQENFFGDFMYRFTLSKEKQIDIEFSVINIFNKKQYRNFSVGSYTLSESYYLLRPRQFLVKLRFPL